MKHSTESTVLTLFFDGRIDSNNAETVGAEALSLVNSVPHESLVIDAEGLEYISSAGLRIILRLRKLSPELKIIGVSTEVYEILDMTGFTEMITVEKAYRRFSVEGCEMLGQGSNGIVYRYNDEIVIKVYRNPDALEDIRRERSLARKALILGIPTAIPFDVVKVGDRFASVFELLNAKSFSKLIREEPENTDKYAALFVELLRQIHETEVSPDDMPSMKKTALDWVDFLNVHLPAEQWEKLRRLVEETPERSTMIHGDYHTNNVEMQNGEVLLIDMDTLAYGHPVFELGSIFLGFVGFGELDNSITEKFMKLPFATTSVLWDKTLRLYLNSEDPALLRSVAEKAQVIGYARLLRRTIRREADTEHGQAQILRCKERLAELLPRVESLDF